MRTKEEILNRINKFKVYIWGNPNRPDDIKDNCCECCGRKLGKNPLFVHINTQGTILPNDISEEDLELVGMESQGCFALGSGCAKKLLGDKIWEYAQKELM